MSGYRGEGYGQYGNVGDDDFRWGGDEREPARGAAQGNLMGRAEREARSFFTGDQEQEDGRGVADDPRAVRAADEYRKRHGREGYEGSYAQHDETYRQYRERHLQQLDEDYAEYCREHGHEFSSAFENWRGERRRGGGVAAMAETSGSPQAESTGEGLLADESSGPAASAETRSKPRGRTR